MKRKVVENSSIKNGFDKDYVCMQIDSFLDTALYFIHNCTANYELSNFASHIPKDELFNVLFPIQYVCQLMRDLKVSMQSMTLTQNINFEPYNVKDGSTLTQQTSATSTGAGDNYESVVNILLTDFNELFEMLSLTVDVNNAPTFYDCCKQMSSFAQNAMNYSK